MRRSCKILLLILLVYFTKYSIQGESNYFKFPIQIRNFHELEKKLTANASLYQTLKRLPNKKPQTTKVEAKIGLTRIAEFDLDKRELTCEVTVVYKWNDDRLKSTRTEKDYPTQIFLPLNYLNSEDADDYLPLWRPVLVLKDATRQQSSTSQYEEEIVMNQVIKDFHSFHHSLL